MIHWEDASFDYYGYNGGSCVHRQGYLVDDYDCSPEDDDEPRFTYIEDKGKTMQVFVHGEILEFLRENNPSGFSFNEEGKEVYTTKEYGEVYVEDIIDDPELVVARYRNW